MKIHVTVGVVTDEFERLEAKCEERVVDWVEGHGRFNDTPTILTQCILRVGLSIPPECEACVGLIHII